MNRHSGQDDTSDNHFKESSSSFVIDGIGTPDSSWDAFSMPIVIAGPLKQIGKIHHVDGEQYIARNYNENELPYSAKFRIGASTWTLVGDMRCLSSANYKAEVRIKPLQLIDDGTNFDDALNLLLQSLEIVKVWSDDQLEKFEEAAKNLRSILLSRYAQIAENLLNEAPLDWFELWSIADHHGFKLCKQLASDVHDSHFISESIKSAIWDFIGHDLTLNDPWRYPNVIINSRKHKNRERMEKFFSNTIQQGIDGYRKYIHSLCPPILEKELNDLCGSHILLIGIDDLKLFENIDGIFNETALAPITNRIASQFCARVRQINIAVIRQSVPLTSRIFYYICKSLWDTAEDLRTRINVSKVIQYNKSNWEIVAPSSNDQDVLPNVGYLHHHLKTFVRLANHYSPGNSTANASLEHEFKVFPRTEMTFRPEVHVWLCLLDETMAQIFHNYRMKSLDKLLENWADYSAHNSEIDCEFLRATTQEILRFCSQVAQLVDEPDDLSIVQKQITSVNAAIFASNSCPNNEYRVLMEKFVDFWQHWNSFFQETCKSLESDVFKTSFERIRLMLRRMTILVLDRKLQLNVLVEFYTCFNEFICGLNRTPLIWLVRLPSQDPDTDVFIKKKAVEYLESERNDSSHKTYKVVRMDHFAGLYRTLNDVEDHPKNYQLTLLECLLEFVHDVAKKSEAQSGNEDQLKALIAAMSSVLKAYDLFSKQLLDSTCFENFYQQISRPFDNAIKADASIEQFSEKMLMIEDIISHMMNPNMVGNTEDQRSALLNYFDQYEEHMTDGIDETKVKHILLALYSKINPKLPNESTADFKQNTLPKILAGLIAVWSSHRSGSSAKEDQQYIISILTLANVNWTQISAEQTGLLIQMSRKNVLKPENVSVFSILVDFYTDGISKECFRNNSIDEIYCVVTMAILQFVVQAELIIANIGNTLNREIVVKQICSIIQRELTLTELHALLEISTSLWKQCQNVYESMSCKLPGKHFEPSILRIQNLLFQIASHALEKQTALVNVTDFLSQFVKFLIHLHNMDHDWYVRLRDEDMKAILVTQNAIEPVDNRWKGTEYECYVVKCTESFTSAYEDEAAIPKHYQMIAVETFLQYINHLATKQNWTNNGEVLTGSDQLKAMTIFIGTVRKLFPYLKEQPDYIQFESILQDHVEPLRSIIDRSESLEDFGNRILLAEDSFGHIRNDNTIGIDDALKFLLAENQSINVEILKPAYLLYQESLEDYLNNTTSLNHKARIAQIIESIHSQAEAKLITSWSYQFKQKTLPKILAGVTAVWILILNATNNSDIYLKPHILQIICALRMLSVDQSATGVEKHLVQVPTGQGKSTILVLIATLLALFGHSVDVMCSNVYLAQRDADNFGKLFELFRLSDRITYKTLSSMMHEQFEFYAAKSEDFTLGAMGLTKMNESTTKQQASIDHLKNSVLLIDEVDVFFMDSFAGKSRSRRIAQAIKGLGEIQIKVWELVATGTSDSVEIRTLIDDFIMSSENPEVRKFKAFIDRPKTYNILEKDRHQLKMLQVTNRTLFLKHLQMMISSAIKVHEQPIDGSFFSAYKLDEEGRISFKNALGEFTPKPCHNGYSNIFVYFKLKGNNFKQYVKGTTHFGYLTIGMASLTYGKLPESYLLMLGITGTQTTFNTYERNAIDNQYNQFSIMPSIFGRTNLQFDKRNDFTCLSTEPDWMKVLYNRIATLISADRSVLVFFNTEVDVSKFKQKFAPRIDRLIVLSVDMEPGTLQHHINDAGRAKTVTLATRAFGRGVDFQSGATVERNGGLHVIQTFFSLDVREETHIKGRTAQRTNHGSYEQIICFEHVLSAKLISRNVPCCLVCYDRLEKARNAILEKNSEAKAGKLASANAMHDMTVNIYRSLENSKCVYADIIF